MENLEPEFIVLSKLAKKHLFSVSKWAKTIAVIGFFVLIFWFLVLIYAIGFSGFANKINVFQLLAFLPSLLMYFIYAYANYKLYYFGKYCNNALKTNDSSLFELSLFNLKQTFKIIGIITVIVIIIFLIATVYILLGTALVSKYF